MVLFQVQDINSQLKKFSWLYFIRNSCGKGAELFTTLLTIKRLFVDDKLFEPLVSFVKELNYTPGFSWSFLANFELLIAAQR